MNSEDFLGPVENFEPDPRRAPEKNMVLTQCHCDNCKNYFFVNGASPEFMPSYCCYCGGEFGEKESMGDGEEFLWM